MAHVLRKTATETPGHIAYIAAILCFLFAAYGWQ